MPIELIRLQIYSALQILVFIFCFHQLETELQFYGDVNSWNVHLLHYIIIFMVDILNHITNTELLR